MKNFITLISFLLLTFTLFSQEDKDFFISIDTDEEINIRSENDNSSFYFSVNKERLSVVTSTHPKTLDLDIPISGDTLKFNLIKNNILSDDFKVTTSRGKNIDEFSNLDFYSGGTDSTRLIITSNAHNNSVSGILYYNSNSYSINKIKGKEIYRFSKDDIEDFECGSTMNMLNKPYSSEELRQTPMLSSSAKCVKIYQEVDYDIFTDKGGLQPTIQYITSLFNEVYTLYKNEGIEVKLNELFIWDSASPYTGGSSYNMLMQFRDNRQSDNGDIYQLLSYQSSGGIAYVNVLCHPIDGVKSSFASIRPTFSNYPNFSWSVMVIAHEIGHNLGSQHTHACVWNGDGTAIDACPGYTEGNCPDNISVPSSGGTIMSYCHINPIGINFTNGFHEQPSNLIKNKINDAGCLTQCTPPDNDNDNGNDNDSDTTQCRVLIVDILLDQFGSEFTWEIVNDQGDVIGAGGPYQDKTEYTRILKEYCLEDGCYELRLLDDYGDGICCQYGEGSVMLRYENGEELMNVGIFDNTYDFEFCVDLGDDPESEECKYVNFYNENNTIKSYGFSQDRGSATILDSFTVKLENNAWKYIDFEYEVTDNTIIEFEFKSTREGEIHGIGLDYTLQIDPYQLIQVYGTQRWGIQTFKNYDEHEQGQWKKYRINLHPTLDKREYPYLFFLSDHDVGFPKGNSYFRNIRVYEDGDCSSTSTATATSTATFNNKIVVPGNANKVNQDIKLYPNPANSLLYIDVSESNLLNLEEFIIKVYDSNGRLLIRNTSKSFNPATTMNNGGGVYSINVSNLTTGSYFLHLLPVSVSVPVQEKSPGNNINGDTNTIIKKFQVINLK